MFEAIWIVHCTIFSMNVSFSLTTDTHVLLDDTNIRVQDVLPDIRNDRIIAKIPEGMPSVILTHGEIARLLRYRAPGLKDLHFYNPDHEIAFVSSSQDQRKHPEGICHVSLTALAEDETLTIKHVKQTYCRPRNIVTTKLRYDRSSNTLKARRNLPAGTYLGKIIVPQQPVANLGDSLKLVVRKGHVQVEKSVTALQSGANGEHIFVKDSKDQVLRAQVKFENSSQDGAGE